MYDNSFDILTVVTNVLKELESISETLNNIEEHLESIDDKIKETNKWELEE